MIQKNSYSEVMYPSPHPLLCDPFEVFIDGKTEVRRWTRASYGTKLPFYFLSPFCPLHATGTWPQLGCYLHPAPPPSPPSLLFKGQDYSALIQVEWVIKGRTKKRRPTPLLDEMNPPTFWHLFVLNDDGMQWLRIIILKETTLYFSWKWRNNVWGKEPKLA